MNKTLNSYQILSIASIYTKRESSVFSVVGLNETEPNISLPTIYSVTLLHRIP